MRFAQMELCWLDVMNMGFYGVGPTSTEEGANDYFTRKILAAEVAE